MYRCVRCNETFLYVNADKDIECVHCGHVLYDPKQHKLDVLLHAVQDKWLGDLIPGKKHKQTMVATGSKQNPFVENSTRIREGFKTMLSQRISVQQQRTAQQ